MTLIVRGTVGRGGFRRDIDFTVEAGHVLGLVGPNGAGKSTVLHTVAGIERMVSGSIVIDGETLDDATTFVVPADRRAVVVFQDIRLFPHMNVLANVAYGPRSHGAPAAEASQRARTALDSVGMGARADRTPGSLSGGERQRVALARAFVTNPRILLLDEPFAAVDAESRPGLRDVLKALLAGSTAHTLVVSHDQADIEDLCGAVVRLGGPREFTD
ncbi:MAG: hypothetical protein RLZZ526_1154 [Actinomycetota bacterium]